MSAARRAARSEHWAACIRDCLQADGFRLLVQPIVPVQPAAGGAQAEPSHHEVLIRMLDGQGRMACPEAFLPAVEEHRLAVRLDKWVIDTTLEFLADIDGAPQPHGRYSINVSGQSVGDETFLPHVRSKLAQTGVAACRLCFEITETAAVDNWDQAGLFMRTLKALGCRFSLDDFGTGYCSFAYLKKLPVDYLKIDGTFVRDLASDPMDLALVRSINDMAHAMGKQTVAEFVESFEVLDMLRQIGVDYAQGYAIGRPLPMAQPRLRSAAA